MIDLKDIIETLGGKPVLVFGLGLTGGSLVKALKKAGAEVVIGDDNPETLAKMQKSLDVNILENYESMERFAFLLLSPGVPLTHPEPHDVVKAAMAANVPVIGDVELFSKAVKGNLSIGITGTNGKSTTSTLVHHILKDCGLKTDLGGNIGKPVFDLKLPKKNGAVVMELSSFQIDLCPTFRPDIAVLLNLTPDHIDRHGTMEHYAAVKERLLEKPEHGVNPVAIIATDDDFCAQICARVREKSERKIIEVSASKQLSDGVYVKDGILFDAREGVLLQVGNLEGIQSLRGIHNAQNAACAYAAAKMAGLESEQIFEAMKTFLGLQHRQFLVRTMNGVGYINDSKATNAAATAMALGCHSNIYWIVGGRKKKTGLDGLEGYFNHIKHAFLIGESMADFAEWFDKYGMEYTRCGTMDRAVQSAHAMAQDNRGQPGGAGAVLLSPACASFDQFKNFEERGDIFTSLVSDLEECV